MLALAMGDGENVSIKSVSESRDINEKRLEQIIPYLTRGGLIVSTRVARGGYQLTKDPEDYTVGEILRTVEGSIAPVFCLDEADPENQCSHCHACVTRDLWEQVDQAISNVVDHVTLADLVDRQRRLDARTGQADGT